MKIRVGIHPSPRYGAALAGIGASALISANALWKRGKFRPTIPGHFGGHNDVALDSAGFVAMVRYGGYRWSARTYIANLVAGFPWAWWAAMDFCCEPQVARDRAEVVSRIARTVASTTECQAIARELAVRSPMLPVLQGWMPDDYVRCADLLGDHLATLTGLGSVCRRHMHGPDGIAAVLARLDRHLPAGIQLHLFGVKGSAIEHLVGHPRVGSADSMAWDFACRRENERRPVETKLRYMVDWWRRQTSARSLFGEAY